MVNIEHRQEMLARAYVQAVAAQAGMSFNLRDADYGIDVSLFHIQRRGRRYYESGVQVDLQLRSTRLAQIENMDVVYDLETKTYDDLRDQIARHPRLLVLLALPADQEHWLDQNENELCLHCCAYWLSLKGREATQATSKSRIRIPRRNVFNANFLQALVGRLQSGAEV